MPKSPNYLVLRPQKRPFIFIYAFRGCSKRVQMMILDRVHTLEGTVGKNVKKVILTTYLGWPCEFSLIFNVLDLGFRGFLEGVLFSWVPSYL